jgi:tRNA(Ile)-lysidine synthetase-like protein
MTEYQQILDYWFSSDDKIPKFWFDKNNETDQYVKSTYTDLLIKAVSHKLNHWKSTPNGHLALIILLDQFSRHIHRNDYDNLYKYDVIAYHYAKEFLLENKDDELSDIQKMMILMPFRHQENIDAYDFVINYVKELTNPIWNNFKKHTLINYEYLKLHKKLPNRPENYKIDFTKFNTILEYPWTPEMQNNNITSDLTNTLVTFCTNNFGVDQDNNLLIVSLSGGVDSMVILTILAIIKKTFSVNLEVVAVHLDYHNREETGLEAEFLFQWCSIMNIPLYYRYIHEGSRERSSKQREEYEELTKQIRFDIYTKVKNLYKSYFFMGVILGHHKGDLQENIFFNTMKGRTLIDLSVIRERSEILGVKILRPLLRHPKSDIFTIAEKCMIPYFKNTTPIWSNRGQYREIIQPAIIKTFGYGVLTNLSKIGQESDDLAMLVKSSIIEPYMKTIKVKDKVHYLPITKDQSFTYWKYIFQEFCYQNKLPIITHKLIGQIFEKISNGSLSNITCNNKITMKLSNTHIEISFI